MDDGCARRIVVVLPALFTRKEVQLGSGTIHEAGARGAAKGLVYTRSLCSDVLQSVCKRLRNV